MKFLSILFLSSLITAIPWNDGSDCTPTPTPTPPPFDYPQKYEDDGPEPAAEPEATETYWVYDPQAPPEATETASAWLDDPSEVTTDEGVVVIDKPSAPDNPTGGDGNTDEGPILSPSNPGDSSSPVVVDPVVQVGPLPDGFEDCGTSNDKVTFQKLSISPWPLVVGQDIQIYAKGQVLQVLKDGANLTITSADASLPFGPMVLDLCNEVLPAVLGLGCSDVTVGDFEINFAIPYPEILPALTLDLKIEGFNGPMKSGKIFNLACLTGPLIVLPAIHKPVIEGCGKGVIGNGICSNESECCSAFGFCGTDVDYCGFDNCIGGPCQVSPEYISRK